MSGKSTNFPSVPESLERPSTAEQNKPDTEQMRISSDVIPSMTRKNHEFWIEDDKVISIQEGELFSITVNRDVASEERYDRLMLWAYRVLSDESNAGPVHIDRKSCISLSGRTVRFWKGKCSLTLDRLCIQESGDFCIAVWAYEFNRKTRSSDIVADFCTKTIHIS
ncbi:hypothetical protein F4814DRAFT_452001 [Daldinia grandis]|nr:hypothetical protein F4814DRAFT_452001 [Daldinia grandis]